MSQLLLLFWVIRDTKNNASLIFDSLQGGDDDANTAQATANKYIEDYMAYFQVGVVVFCFMWNIPCPHILVFQNPLWYSP